MKTGDKVRLKNIRNPSSISKEVYTIVEIIDQSIKVKHPSIKGHFIFLKSAVLEVINEN